MLQVGPFDDFKGEDVLLIWGDAEGVATLHEKLQALASGSTRQAEIGKGTSPALLLISLGRETGSRLSIIAGTIFWTLSEDTLSECLQLVEALSKAQQGHLYFGVEGDLIKMVVISQNEYPAVMPVRVAE